MILKLNECLVSRNHDHRWLNYSQGVLWMNKDVLSVFEPYTHAGEHFTKPLYKVKKKDFANTVRLTAIRDAVNKTLDLLHADEQVTYEVFIYRDGKMKIDVVSFIV